MSNLDLANKILNGQAWFLYTATNLTNGMKYVGITKHACNRMKAHLMRLKNRTHINKAWIIDHSQGHEFVWKVEGIYLNKKEGELAELETMEKNLSVCYNPLAKKKDRLRREMDNKRKKVIVVRTK